MIASVGASNCGELTLGHPHPLSGRAIPKVLDIGSFHGCDLVPWVGAAGGAGPGLARRPMRAVQDPTPGVELTRGTMPRISKIEAGRRPVPDNQPRHSVCLRLPHDIKPVAHFTEQLVHLRVANRLAAVVGQQILLRDIGDIRRLFVLR